MLTIKRTQKEIDELHNWANEGQDEGSHYPGMSYEDGIDATIRWIMGHDDVRPDQDE